MYINELQERLKDLILNTCNIVGCDECGLQFDSPYSSGSNECSATDLQDRIADLQESKEDDDALGVKNET